MSESKFEEIFGSEFFKPTSYTVCRCSGCGATATFYGSPIEVNKASEEFYRLHNQHLVKPKESK